MDSFRPNEIITDPKLLFGRNGPGQLLDQALCNIRRRTPFQLYGERRSGKTSILSCLSTILESDFKYVPLFLDFKKNSFIRGNANVFRYILAKYALLLSRSFKFTGSISLGDTTLKFSNYWEDIYEDLQSYQDFRIQGLLEKFMTVARDHFDKICVLLIDEYEFLFSHSFDSSNGFFVLRELSSIPDAPLIYVVAGAIKWDELCSKTGSAELNNLGGSLLYVSPLDYENFENMWFNWLNEIEGAGVIDECVKIYDLSGGIPFFAKWIGECQLSGVPSQMIDINLAPHFMQILNNLNTLEKRIISTVINGDQPEGIYSDDLLYRGILKLIDNRYDINGLLFKKFVCTRQNISSPGDDKQIKLWEYGRKIQSLITQINDTNLNKNGKNMFEISNGDLKYYEDMSTLGVERDDINIFASAIYITLFERSSSQVIIESADGNSKNYSKNLERLPDKFKRKNEFVQIVDSLRHFYGGHNTYLETFKIHRQQLKKSEVLSKLTDSTNEPYTSAEIFCLQENLLKMFIQYLTDLNNYIREPIEPAQ